jgi:hypothetical protein
MSAASPEDREVRIGRIFERAIGAVRANAVLMIGIALVLGAIPLALSTYVFNLFVPNLYVSTPTNPFTLYLLTGRGAAAQAATSFVNLLFGTITNGALIHATIARFESRRASLGECLDAAASVFVPLVGLSILYWLGLIVGFLFLVIPGLLMWCIWFVAKPVLVIERTSMIGAFGRSKDLTAFQGWKILGILLIVLMVAGVARLITQYVGFGILGPGPFRSRPSDLLLALPVSTLSSLLWPTVQASAYIELRNAKEGAPVDRLQEVFA